jgi:hypothetical protein
LFTEALHALGDAIGAKDLFGGNPSVRIFGSYPVMELQNVD